MQIDRQVEANVGKKDELLLRLEQGATLLAASMADPEMVSPPPVALPAEPVAPTLDENGQPIVAEPVVPTPEEVHAYYYTRSIQAFDEAETKVNEWEE